MGVRAKQRLCYQRRPFPSRCVVAVSPHVISAASLLRVDCGSKPREIIMLVIHWAKQNKTNSILANGIRPACRKDKETGAPKNSKGVYVYPFSRHKTLRGNWRRNLKTWDTSLGNYNGFVFRLEPEDFPLTAGYWFSNRRENRRFTINSLQELTEQYGDFFSGEIVNITEDGIPYNWEDFEIILPHHIEARRLLKVIKDREPKRKDKGKLTNQWT
jgi:hypothetical protein